MKPLRFSKIFATVLMMLEQRPKTDNFASEFFDERNLNWTLQTIQEVSTALGIGHGGKNFDARRIAVTIEYMKRFGLSNGRVAEIGSLDYLCSQVLWRHFPHAKPTGTNNDLRVEPLTFDDNSVDALICLEVIEHLSDVPYQQATILSGLFFFLDEVYRILRTGGKALFTTPNAASFWNIQRAFLQEPPMMYPWHFREFTVGELRQIMEHAGFEILMLKTEYVWHLWNFEPIREFLHRHGYSTDDRGDDIFMVVSKPSTRVRKSHTLQLPL